MKTLDELYKEIEEARGRNLIRAIHYYNQTDDPFHYPRHFGAPTMSVVSLEFNDTTSGEIVQKVYEYIKRSYGSVLFEVRLITSHRINVYVMTRLP